MARSDRRPVFMRARRESHLKTQRNGWEMVSRCSSGPELLEPWQFLMLEPRNDGTSDGGATCSRWPEGGQGWGNVAEYLNEIRRLDLHAFQGLLDAVRHVLPYN